MLREIGNHQGCLNFQGLRAVPARGGGRLPRLSSPRPPLHGSPLLARRPEAAEPTHIKRGPRVLQVLDLEALKPATNPGHPAGFAMARRGGRGGRSERASERRGWVPGFPSARKENETERFSAPRRDGAGGRRRPLKSGAPGASLQRASRAEPSRAKPRQGKPGLVESSRNEPRRVRLNRRASPWV